AREVAAADLAPEEAPPWRIYLIRVHAARQLAVLVVHALLADEDRGAGPLLQQWRMLIDGSGKFVSTDGQYHDYVEARREGSAQARMGEAVAWWRAHLADAPGPCALPTDRPRG